MKNYPPAFRGGNLLANLQLRVLVSPFYQMARRVRRVDRQAVGANHKASRDWGILNRLDLCSPGLRFRRFLRPRGANKYALTSVCLTERMWSAKWNKLGNREWGILIKIDIQVQANKFNFHFNN